VKCFFDTRATIANVADEDVIDYFHNGIAAQKLYRDFECNRPDMVVKLRNMMQRWTNEKEQERDRFPHRNNNSKGRGNNNRGNGNS